MRAIFLLLASLGLAACGEQATTTTTEKARPAPALMPATPAAQPTLAAVPLGAHFLQTMRVGSTALRFDPASNVQVDTIQGRFLQITAPDSLPRLLFRTSRRDTVWTELLLEMPDNLNQGGDITQSTITFSLDNLDQQGQPELFVTVSQSDVGGNAGREDWRWINIIDLTHKPLLLLSAGTAAESEAYPQYAAMHGSPIEAGEGVSGCSRRISLRRHEVLIGPIKTKGDTPECPLTALAPGRYRYQSGRLAWVGK
ncbi:hypothetical protein GKZ68_16215 [Hymenobacter sp. BRD128]|uniref:hypothetical protein n=1 Tax=Hymenobacter sp. BRD128 TaxID=2675878 RepID=UPI0015676D56|nr:hypothetical protein [Hymenobacter sp. BRD128]QKG58028.1 hypothetical protein GKZ68_16215 [Hymenobacter sp. BRD128]